MIIEVGELVEEVRVISGFFETGTMNGVNQVYLEFISLYDDYFELEVYDLLTIDVNPDSEFMVKMQFLLGDKVLKNFDLNEIIGKAVRIRRSLSNNRKMEYIRKFPHEINLSEQQISTFDFESEPGHSLLLSEFPDFIARRIEDSDEYLEYVLEYQC